MTRFKSSRWLSGLVAGIFAFALGTGVAQIVQRPTFPATGKSAGISYFSSGSAPTVAADGELAIVSQGVGNASQLQYWDSASTADAWIEIPAENAVLANFANNVTLGSSEDDFIDVNAPARFRVIREDFEGPNTLAIDITNGDYTPSVADAEFNMYQFQYIDMWNRIEIAFAGTNDIAVFVSDGTLADAQGRVFLLDSASILDVTDNDAIEYNFGGDPTDAILFDEDNSDGLDVYCEVSLRLDLIANVSALDFYFGFFLAAAVNDTFAFTASNSWAAFDINDTAGDLQICAEEDGDTHGCDDAGTTWANDATHVLRVEIGADAVAFLVDGTAVSATNAVLDPDASEQYVCRLGVRSAGSTAAGWELNYVEIGKAQ